MRACSCKVCGLTKAFEGLERVLPWREEGVLGAWEELCEMEELCKTEELCETEKLCKTEELYETEELQERDLEGK